MGLDDAPAYIKSTPKEAMKLTAAVRQFLCLLKEKRRDQRGRYLYCVHEALFFSLAERMLRNLIMG